MCFTNSRHVFLSDFRVVISPSKYFEFCEIGALKLTNIWLQSQDNFPIHVTDWVMPILPLCLMSLWNYRVAASCDGSQNVSVFFFRSVSSRKGMPFLWVGVAGRGTKERLSL